MNVDGPRPVGVDERDELIVNLNWVMREEVGNAPTYHLDWPHVLAPENLGNINRVKVDGKIVSSTGLWPHENAIGAARIRVGGVNGVATHTEYRRHGFATTLLQASIARMKELDCHISLLSTGVPSWYRKSGWEYAGTRRVYRFDRGSWPLLPEDSSVTVRAAAGGDFVRLAEIHNARRFGAIRTADLMRTSFGRRERPTWVGLRDGRIEGYVWGEVANLREYGGSAEVVLPMLRHLYAQADDPSIKTSTQSVAERQRQQKPTLHSEFAAPDYSDAVTDALDEIGAMYTRAYCDMIRLENIRGLLDGYGVYDVQVDDRGDSVEFRRGNEHVTLSRTQASKLLFGPERPSRFASDVLPLRFHEWPADLV